MSDHNGYTLATPANMRRFAELNPDRILSGGGRILGRTCFAHSPGTGEQCSASAGDYFMLADDEPLMDADGNPMYLAVSRTIYTDAFNGEMI